MTIEKARIWLVLASLVICCVSLLFFLIAPVTPYPLEWAQSLRLLEIITPVFFGYLGLATRYVFSRVASEQDRTEVSGLLLVLLKGPIFIFAIVAAGLLISFGWANTSDAMQANRMSIDVLSAAFATLLSLLTVTTNVIAEHLFARTRR